MFISKFLRARLIIFTIILLFLWITYYYTFRSSSTSSTKDTTGLVSLVPEMPYGVMNAYTDATVLITVFYECLCPDSRSFFADQLLPLIEEIPAYISTDLVPYGKATTEIIRDDLYRFKCQHGPLECLGNKIHACTITRIKDDLTKVKVVTCMINDNYNAEKIGQKCCEEFNVDWAAVETCALGSEGNELLKKHGDATNKLFPKVSFIPTILLNKEKSNQAAILKNLKEEVCGILKKMSKAPKECD